MRRHPDRLAAAFCSLVGVVIATLPHLIAWVRSGEPIWVADHDERYYLAVASQAYLNHPFWLSDPVRAQGGPSLYRPLPLLPGVWAARILATGPLCIGLMWRAGGGFTIGLAWYALIRLYVKSPRVAAAMAVILLSDGGLLDGRLFYRQAKWVAEIAIQGPGVKFATFPMAHPEWRITTPSVTMAYLIFLLWSLRRARDRDSRGRVALAGLAFGLLFYVYFYYWTAAGLALLIALALDAGHRRVYWHAGWIGGLIGLPALIRDAYVKRTTAPDWLLRTDKFVPIGHFDELLVAPPTVLLLVVGLVWILARRRDLIHVWALTASAWLLSNHQMFTGLQIENFHWKFALGPTLCLLLLLALASWLSIGDDATERPAAVGPGLDRRVVLRGLILPALAVMTLVSGLWLRDLETIWCVESLGNTRVLSDYRVARTTLPPRGLVAGSVVGGDNDFVDYAAIVDNLRPLSNYWVTLSPSVTDAEWDDRLALNSLVLGQTRQVFEAAQRSRIELNRWGPGSRDASLRSVQLRSLLAAYDRGAADLPAALARFGVRYVALRAGTLSGHLSGSFSLIGRGPTWDVWERPIAPGNVQGR